MTEEIKEKLDLFKYCVEKNEYLEVSNMKEWKPLLNYITNLQNEIEKLRDTIKKDNHLLGCNFSKKDKYKQEKDIYKQRNEKAVEYIKTIANADKSVRSTIAKMILVDYKILLNILQGENDD